MVSKDWLTSKCSCVFWAKNYKCHHVVGLAVFKGRAVYQDLHKTIPIGQNRPRGQPKKTAGALIRQTDRKSSDSSSDSTDSDPSPIKKVVKKGAKKGQQSKDLPKKRGRKPKQK